MQKQEIPIMFTCPECKENFEFDNIGEHELVPCPVCGLFLITQQQGGTLLLQCFDVTSNNTEEANQCTHRRIK